MSWRDKAKEREKEEEVNTVFRENVHIDRDTFTYTRCIRPPYSDASETAAGCSVIQVI